MIIFLLSIQIKEKLSNLRPLNCYYLTIISAILETLIIFENSQIHVYFKLELYELRAKRAKIFDFNFSKFGKITFLFMKSLEFLK